MNLYLNDDDIRYLPEKEETAVNETRRTDDHSFDRRRLLLAANVRHL